MSRAPLDRRVDLGEVVVNYRLEGPAGAPVVVLAHGLLGSLHMWAPQVRALARRYRVLRFDNRGHGLSSVGNPPGTLEQHTRDTLALMDALGIERAHLVGCSLGGMVGQQFAAAHPARLLSLVLVGTLSVMPPVSMWDERVRVARERGIAPLLPVMLDRWFTPRFRDRRPAPVQAIARGVLGTPVEGFVAACTAIRNMDLRQALAAIRVPTLVMAADRDPGVPLASTHALHEAIAGSEMAVVRGARHLFSVERPRLFTRLLLEWLARH